MTAWETSCICMHVWSMSSQTTSLGMARYFVQMYADRVMTRLIQNLKCAVVSTVHNMYSLKSQHFDIFCNYDHLIAYALSSTCVWHAADTDNIVGQNRSNVHVIFKITSLQFRCLKISQAVDCHIGSFASSGSYLASFDGSQNRWFLAMVRNCAGLKSLKTYREELTFGGFRMIEFPL